ncbi:hypothetical protein, partial [Rhodococcus sp. 3-2]|uniref:hypothetical protein n=1 Tax=Rhodococcus sp. 3-2 TaxID=2890836 RepID=UPI001D18581A
MFWGDPTHAHAQYLRITVSARSADVSECVFLGLHAGEEHVGRVVWSLRYPGGGVGSSQLKAPSFDTSTR